MYVPHEAGGVPHTVEEQVDDLIADLEQAFARAQKEVGGVFA